MALRRYLTAPAAALSADAWLRKPYTVSFPVRVTGVRTAGGMGDTPRERHVPAFRP